MTTPSHAGPHTQMASDSRLDEETLAAKYDDFISSTTLYYRLRHVTRAGDAVFNAIENLRYRRRIAAPIDPPIFPLGNFRSGTSFLEKVIADHRDVGHFTYTSQVFPRAAVIPGAVVRRVPALNQPMLPFHLPDEVDAESPYEGEPIWRFCRNNPWTDDPVNVLDADFADPDFERVLHGAIVKHLISQGAARFVNKNPWNTLRVGYLARLYPDAGFVYIVRHPNRMLRSQLDLEAMSGRAFRHLPDFNDVFSDQFRPPRKFFRTGRSGAYAELHGEDPELAVAMSIADFDATFDEQVAAAGIGDRVHVVRYEDLLADFAPVMTRIFRFLDLDPVEADRVVEDNERNYLRKDLVSASSPPPRFGPEVQAVLDPLIDKYGYPAAGSGP